LSIICSGLDFCLPGHSAGKRDMGHVCALGCGSEGGRGWGMRTQSVRSGQVLMALPCLFPLPCPLAVAFAHTGKCTMRHLVHLSSVLEQFQGHQSLPAHTHTSSTLLAHKYKSAVGHDSLSKTLAGWLAGSLSFLAFWACAGSCVNMRAILSVGRCAARLSIPLGPRLSPPLSPPMEHLGRLPVVVAATYMFFLLLLASCVRAFHTRNFSLFHRKFTSR